MAGGYEDALDKALCGLGFTSTIMDGRRNELGCAEVGFGSIVGTGCSTWNIMESESGRWLGSYGL